MMKNILLAHQITISNNKIYCIEISFLHFKYKTADLQKSISQTFYANKIKTPESSNTEQSTNMVNVIYNW